MPKGQATLTVNGRSAVAILKQGATVKEMTTCSKCGSDKIIPNASIKDGGGMPIVVNVYDHPDALVFKGAHTSTLHSQICGDCGYVESYVQNPQELHSVYLASRQPQE